MARALRNHTIVRTSTAAASVVLAISCLPLSHAIARANGTNHRFHVATPGLYQRLGPQARANLDAVAVYRTSKGSRGTAFLVTPVDRDGYALAMTNRHVASKRTLSDAKLRFTLQGERSVDAPVVDLVARSYSLDYALVRVKLPPRARGLRPALLEGRGLRSSEVYSIGFPELRDLLESPAGGARVGFVADRAQLEAVKGSTTLFPRPRLGALYRRAPGAYLAAGKLLPPKLLWKKPDMLQGRRLALYDYYKAQGTPKTIQLGGRASVPRSVLATLGWSLRGQGIATRSYNLPGRGGSSGSPIISAASHRVESLLHGGPRANDRVSHGHDMGAILASLARKSRRGSIAPGHRALVDALVKAASER